MKNSAASDKIAAITHYKGCTIHKITAGMTVLFKVKLDKERRFPSLSAAKKAVDSWEKKQFKKDKFE
jgi:hypothetical protein